MRRKLITGAVISVLLLLAMAIPAIAQGPEPNIVTIGDIGARVFHSEHQSIPHHINTTLSFDGEVWDTDNMHDCTTNNNRITINTSGKYIVGANIRWSETDHPESHMRSIRLWMYNYQTSYPVMIAIATWPNSDIQPYWMHQNINTVWEFDEGDYVTVVVKQFCGETLEIHGGETYTAHFWAQRID